MPLLLHLLGGLCEIGMNSRQLRVMPPRAQSICTYPGCSAFADSKTRRCDSHPPVWERKGAAAPDRVRGRPLQRMRAALFSENPLCVECEKTGRVELATIRDHVIPLAEGGADDKANSQGLCVTCHDIKSSEERLRGLRGRPKSLELT